MAIVISSITSGYYDFDTPPIVTPLLVVETYEQAIAYIAKQALEITSDKTGEIVVRCSGHYTIVTVPSLSDPMEIPPPGPENLIRRP